MWFDPFSTNYLYTLTEIIDTRPPELLLENGINKTK